MTPRRPAPGGVSLSPVSFGTMRLAGVADRRAAADLLRGAIDGGISTFHCSSEYPSFELFSGLWRELGDARSGTQLIAKVGVPHFGEDSFDPAAFRAKIEGYLSALAVDRVDVVQWLLRYDIAQPEARLRILAEGHERIADIVQALRSEGKMGAFVAFPYDQPMAHAVLATDLCDGLAVYLNPLEREMEQQVRRCGEMGNAVVAIRPFAAGRLFQETDLDAQAALSHALSFPQVATTVASVSSVAHLDALLPLVTRGGATG